MLTSFQLESFTLCAQFLPLVWYTTMIIISRVILYSGVPLSHHAEMAYRNTCAKSNYIFLNHPVLQFSQTGYQTEVMCL